MSGTGLKHTFFSCFFLCCSLLIAQNSKPLAGKSLYDEGIELYGKGQYGNAQKNLDLYWKQKGVATNVEIGTNAEYYAALCAMKLFNKDAKSRVVEFSKAYELSPLTNRLNFAYANYRFSTKRYREASEYYALVDKFRLSGEELNELLFKKGYSLLMNEKNKDAQGVFFQLKDKESKYSNSARYYYSHLLYVDSNYAEALTNFLPLQNDENFGRLVPYYLAHIYYKLDDYNKLVEVGEALVENATPKRAPEIAKLLSDAFYRKKDYGNTIKYLELFKEKEGKMRQVDHFQLGYSYYKVEKYQLAIESFNKISSGNDELKQNAFYHLGDCYLKVEEKKQAITAFKAASELKHSEFIREDAYFNYAKLVYELSDPYQDAITTLNNFIKEFPKSRHKSLVNQYLANLYLTTKDYDRALLAIQRAGLESPEMQETYQKIAFYRATQIFNSLRYVEAIKKYNESLKYPVNRSIKALSIYWKAESYYRLKQYDKALNLFETFRNSSGALSLSEYTHSQYQTAYCYYKKFDFQKAATTFRAYTRDADKKDARLPDAYLRMADSYFLTGGYLIAADFYSSAVKYKTKEADYALYQRAACLGLTGKRSSKIGELNTLIKRFPNSDYAEDATYEIAETYLRLEVYDKALLAYEDYMNKYPQSQKVASSKMQIGLIYSNTDKNQQALDAFRNVVKDYPGTDQSLEAVGLARLIYARLNRINDYLDWVEGLDFINFKQSTLDSTAYNAAFDLYSEGDCEQTISAFSGYIDRFTKGIFALKANYYLAECGEKVGDVKTTLMAFENITKLPRNEYSVWATEKLAYNDYQLEDYASARSYYKKMASISDSRSDRLKANTGIMRSSFKLGDYSEAAIYADLVLGMETENLSLLQETRDIAAISNYKTENFDEALNQFMMISVSAEGESKARALYHIAEIQFTNEEYDSTEVTIYKLIEDLPAFKEYKMKALILLSKTFWKKENVFQANYTLDFVIKTNFNEETVKQAELIKEQIAEYEREQEALKTKKLQEAEKPILLDEDSGLMIFDEPEEMGEDLEEIIDTNIRKN